MALAFRLLFSLIFILFAVSGWARSDCAVTTGQAEVEGGVIHYETAGAGPDILFLHGIFASKEHWDGILCQVAAAGYRVVAPDLPGYGQSTDFSVKAYRLERQVDLVSQFLNALGVRRLHLAGNSLGGTLAALFARSHPERVISVAFIGGPLGIVPWGPAVQDAIFDGINPFIPVTTQEYDLELSLLLMKVPVMTEEAKQEQIKPYVENNRHYHQVWDMANLYQDVLAHMGVQRLPALILWGEGDAVFSVEGLEPLRKRYPRSHAIRLKGQGHLPMLDDPGVVATHYLKFLRRVRG